MPRVTVNLSDTEAAKIDQGRGLAASVAAAVNAALRGGSAPAKRKPAKKAKAAAKPKPRKAAAKRKPAAKKKAGGAKLSKAAFLARMAAGRKKAAAKRRGK